ncbi:group III truncated hemoglobin [Acuticoccus sediminis]|uniref:group III truncated hemoglobin n=1 Tax=Acuticoccus sediminis TaxID=2184697 RepID=UPI001CFC5154|nr:group III truncated hemoglobin [Acuticoccus sediminis]
MPPIESAALRPLVEAFYERVRADPLLGPIFAAAVHDWDDHHARLTDFWSTVMLGTGLYKGSPVALHIRHASAMTPERFERWLGLWRETSEEMLPPAAAAAVQAKAARIAQSLQLAADFHRQRATTRPHAPAKELECPSL